MNGSDLDLADRYLDGDLDAAGWARARTGREADLDAALARASAERAALSGLARPALPAALRERLLAAAPRTPQAHGGPNPGPTTAPPAARRGRWWKAALPIAAALGALALTVGLLPHGEPSPAAAPAPVVAKQDERKDQAQDRRRQAAPVEEQERGPEELTKASQVAAPLAMRANDKLERAASEGRTGMDQGLQEAVPADGVAGAEPMLSRQADAFAAPPSAPTASSAPAPTALPAKPSAPAAAVPGGDGLQVAAAWHRPEADGGGAKEAAKRAEDQALGAPGEAPGTAAESPPDDRVLRITLRNAAATPLTLPPGSIRLVGLSRSGSTLWRTPLRPRRETVVPAGGEERWDEAVPVIPPGAAHLRVEAQGVRSVQIEP